MGDPYEEAARARRAPAIQQAIDEIARAGGISKSFMAASDHPYLCKCDKCLSWWADMGPDEDESFGPFTEEEVKQFCAQNEKPIWWEEE